MIAQSCRTWRSWLATRCKTGSILDSRFSFQDFRVRRLHISCQVQGSAKRAQDLIKLVNDSSLTQAEGANKNWRADTRAPGWKRQKLALKDKFKGEQWNPKKKLSREQMESVRLLKHEFPSMSASQLGEQFKVSPEVIRRILKSKWEPDEKEQLDLQVRWKKRNDRINQMSSLSGVTSLPQKNLVIGSGRSNPDLLVKGIRKRFQRAPESKTEATSKGKRKLNLLSKLIQ